VTITNFQQSPFPTVESVTQLWRSLVNDTFTGLQGPGGGRIATDNAPFTLPFLNTALANLQRRMRNEGCNFPIIDGYLLNAVPAVPAPDPSVFVSIGFNGSNNGTTNSPTPLLPGNLMQVYRVRARLTGSGQQFIDISEAQEGLASTFQNQAIGKWEFRNYALFVNGSTQVYDLMIRYLSGQPPINAPAADFPTTPIYILDSVDALAYSMAADYGAARNANPTLIDRVQKKAEGYIDDMISEYVRRQQTVPFRRRSYQGGGSNDSQNAGGSYDGVGQ
jgi:hypothetical protein